MNPSFSYHKYFELITNGKTREAFSYRAEFTPEYLYKFFWLCDDPNDPENTKRFNTLENNQIWFAKPEMQNDPYEFKGIYIDKAKLCELGVASQSIDVANDLFLKSIVLTAFTANMSNNLPMWAHYSNNHKGYCVKYKVGNKHTIRNVIYESKRISMSNTFFNFLQKTDYGVKFRNNKYLEEAQIFSSILQDMFFMKHDSWEYEHEFRALYPFDGDAPGTNVSIDELGLSVIEIYSGINCSKGNEIQLSQIASKLCVPFRKCQTSSTEFSIF